MASTSDFRNGYTMMFRGNIVKIIEFMHVKPGKGPAFVRTKLKIITTGQIIDNTFRAGEKVEDVRLEAKMMQYIYADDTGYYFMDTDTYDQIPLPHDLVEDVSKFLKEGTEIKIIFHGTTAIDIEMPPFIKLEIAQTDPGVKGDTAQGGSKPATLETGAVVSVPLFIQEGETIKIDTRSGDYVERVK